MATQITKLVCYHDLRTLIVNPDLGHCFRCWYSSMYRHILPLHIPFCILRSDSYSIDTTRLLKNDSIAFNAQSLKRLHTLYTQ